MNQVDLQFELTLQDLRQIVFASLGVGDSLSDIFLKLSLPFFIVPMLLDFAAGNAPSLELIGPFLLLALGVPAFLEVFIQALNVAMVARHTHRVRVRASERELVLIYGAEARHYPWHRIAKIRWTPDMVVLRITAGKDVHLPRHFIPETAATFLRRHARNIEGESSLCRWKTWLGTATLIAVIAMIRLVAPIPL